MPVRMSNLVADRRTINFPVGDDTLRIVYKPSTINAKQEIIEREMRDQRLFLGAMAKSLATMIVDWDLQDDAGNQVPITEEVLGELGIDVLRRLQQAIMEDLLPNQRPAENSPSTSVQTGDTAARRNGSFS